MIDGYIAYTLAAGGTEASALLILEAARDYMNNLPTDYSPTSSLMNCTPGLNISEEEADFISRIGTAFNEATDSASLINELLTIELDMNSSEWEPMQDVGRSVMSGSKHGFCYWFSTLDLGLQWAIYTVSMDVDAYQHQRKGGTTKETAEHIMFLVSDIAARGWRPGTTLPECQ